MGKFTVAIRQVSLPFPRVPLLRIKRKSLPHAAQELFIVIRLGQKVDRALAHRVRRHRDIAMCGQEDERQEDVFRLQHVDQFDAVHARHPDIQDQAAAGAAIEFAYFVLNEKYGALAEDGQRHLRTLKPVNTIVIASSASNGAGAALAAAEQDTGGLISGIAVSEPQCRH